MALQRAKFPFSNAGANPVLNSKANRLRSALRDPGVQPGDPHGSPGDTLTKPHPSLFVSRVDDDGSWPGDVGADIENQIPVPSLVVWLSASPLTSGLNAFSAHRMRLQCTAALPLNPNSPFQFRRHVPAGQNYLCLLAPVA